MSNFSTAPYLGAKFDATEDTASHTLGTQTDGNQASVFMYCQASTALSAYDAAVVDNSYKANPITTALTTAGAALVFPQVSVTAASYFWGVRYGHTKSIRVAASCAASAPLYTTATAGVLDDAVANNLIEGVRIVTTQASTTGLTGAAAYLEWPRIGASV